MRIRTPLLPISNNKSIGLVCNKRGVALLQAMFLVMLITFLVNQVNFEVAVEYTVNSQALHRVRAYHAARAGLELSLLRIKIYQRLINGEAGMKLEDNLASMIYTTPVSWPMTLPAEMSAVDKDGFEKVNKEALMDATYATQIQSEEKLNLNDLGSPVQAQRDKIKGTILEILEAKAEQDRDWADKNRNLSFEELVNNIQDWIDSDTESGNGGNERQIYGKIRELDPDLKDALPPNRFFRSMEEVRMVPGVTEDIFAILQNTFSVFGPLGINPNYADAETIKSLHGSLTDEIVSKVIARRNDPREGGPFTSHEDFFDFVNREGARMGEESKELPLVFSSKPCSFRIQSTGSSGKTVTTITAITFDQNCANASLLEKDFGQTEKKNEGEENRQPGPGTTNNQGSGQTLSKGPPRIVYWNEK